MSHGMYRISALCGKGRPNYAFWDDALTLNTSTPDLTVCFQKTVLLWVPCGWLWACALFYYIYYLYKRPTRHTKWDFSWINFIKILTSTSLCLLTLISLCMMVNRPDLQPVDLMYGTVRFATMVLAALFVRWEYMKGIHSSGTSSVFWLLQFTCDVIILRSWILREKVDQHQVKQYIVFTVYFGLVIVMFLLTLLADKGALKWTSNEEKTEEIPLMTRSSQKDEEQHEQENQLDLNDEKTLPELYVSFWNKVVFLWMVSIILKQYKGQLSQSSLFNLKPSEKCCQLVTKFYNSFNKHQPDGRRLRIVTKVDNTSTGSKGYSFIFSLFWSAGYKILPGLVLHVIGQGILGGQAMLLGKLIQLTERATQNTWEGILLAVCLFLTGALRAVFYHNFMYWSYLAALHMKSITCAVVYRKALRLSEAAKREATKGHILNLMSLDAQKLQDLGRYGIGLFEVMVDITICTLLMWNVIGPAVFSGAVLLCILIPINGYSAGNWIKRFQIKQMHHKDRRMKQMSEILSAIKIIKLYAWEIPFMEKIMSARDKELHYTKLANIVGAISSTIWFLLPYMMSATIFTTYVLISPTNILDPYTMFVTVSLINIINQSTRLLPIAISTCGQAILIQESTFSWDKNGQGILKNISLSVPKGQLVAIVGRVGSGKSSLLSAILGDMPKQHGSINVNGSIAYVPQQAWIQNARLRDNVLFNKEQRMNRYASVIEATGLLPDLNILPDGDMTEIGENGVNLSGGQKQRVSLARAVYQDKDIYLLDDPLSAVDAHVGKHIFEKVISNKGPLKDKTRILVTHSLSILPYVDKIVVMNDGIISETGTYKELTGKKGSLSEFLDTFSRKNEENHLSEEINYIYHDVPGSIPRIPNRLQKNNPCTFADRNPIKLINDEHTQTGTVRAAVVLRYVRAAGIKVVCLALIFFALFTGFQVVTNLWLRQWSADDSFGNSTIYSNRLKVYLGVYGALGVGQTTCALILFIACSLGCISASHHLHCDLLNVVIRAPMSFFDCTPLGRVLNRCSKDMDLIDSTMVYYIFKFFFYAGPIIAAPFVISTATPMFLIPFIPIVVIWVILQHVYIRSACQWNRIEGVSRSLIYAHFDETMSGASSIRAYQRELHFIDKCDHLIDENQKVFYYILVAPRCLGVMTGVLGSIIVFFAALFAVLSQDSLPRGMAALSVSYAMNITCLLNHLVRTMTDLETNMVSVERIDEYCHITQEADWQIQEVNSKNILFREGHIQMHNYGCRYRPGLDLSLRDIDCDILPRQKVGIVGRTGAGKSSIALALVRIIEATVGNITIDRIHIETLGLHNLRSQITIIPQDPVIFSGSLQYNLDPFSVYSEKRLWDVLEQAHLKTFVQSLPAGLDSQCGEGGQSLSAGQRQLVCLARAILRKTKVLILDEATAAVDLEIDALIQRTIRDIFADCTVLAIAHRLSTVMDYDKVMVVEQGQIMEFDSPENLLTNTTSFFCGLAREAGMI